MGEGPAVAKQLNHEEIESLGREVVKCDDPGYLLAWSVGLISAVKLDFESRVVFRHYFIEYQKLNFIKK